ncbi:MAG: ABC transporter permease [Oscillospiraceae bacterium]|jgi:ribose/xylose/arabinose/galactoside ABC-type transport system permease subunit|nr:ABC transporter permease [Oscillospiraceae bacterium]
MTKKKEGGGSFIRSLTRHKVFTLVLLFLALVLVFTGWSRLVNGNWTGFFKTSTLRNVLNSMVITSFLTIGAGCLLIGGHIDLSQAAIGAFGGMILATSIKGWSLPWFVGIIIALLFCALLGAINATLVTRFNFPAFIGTLAMSSMAKGLMYMFSAMGVTTGKASNIAFTNKYTDFLGNGALVGIPLSVIIMVLFFIVYGILISKTKFGMKVMLMGGNPVSAHLAGINSTRITYILFINSAVLGGVSGVFNTSRLSQGALLALQTNQFTGITAAMLGGISFGGGAGGMGGAFVGLLILNTFTIGINIVKFDQFWKNVFTGVLLLVALTIDYFAQMRLRRTVSGK